MLRSTHDHASCRIGLDENLENFRGAAGGADWHPPGGWIRKTSLDRVGLGALEVDAGAARARVPHDSVLVALPGTADTALVEEGTARARAPDPLVRTKRAKRLTCGKRRRAKRGAPRDSLGHPESQLVEDDIKVVGRPAPRLEQHILNGVLRIRNALLTNNAHAVGEADAAVGVRHREHAIRRLAD